MNDGLMSPQKHIATRSGSLLRQTYRHWLFPCPFAPPGGVFTMYKHTFFSLLLLSSFAHPALAQPSSFDPSPIEAAVGIKGTLNPAGDVYKISKPRPGMNARINGWTLPPFLGSGSWAAFTPSGEGRVMVMGDNVLFEDEVAATLSAALDNGLEVTALHNHFFYDQPKLYYMHISGMGSPATVGAAVKAVLDTPEKIRKAHPTPASDYSSKTLPAENHITGAPLESLLGAKGEANNGMFKITLGRETNMRGQRLGGAMGVSTWAGFAGTDEQAVVAGDFAVLEGELQAVLKSLEKSDINILAIHQHMTHEEPRILFLHYWGQGKAQDLAKALRAAVNLTSTPVH
jgi:hypothetical protein